MKRIPQPPINRALRPREQHEFWPGFIFALIGAVILFCGATHISSIETVDGNSATEVQLVKAFATGGLEYFNPIAVPEPVEPNDPAAQANAMEKMERMDRQGKPRYRVNTGIQTPCPT